MRFGGVSDKMKGIKRDLQRVIKGVQNEIEKTPDGFFSKGLAGEGFAGGYLQALMDVQLALSGVTPNSRYDKYWRGKNEEV